ncbi:MAG: (deoxy)nucleoside triphosphate pyrophosphohydrolase [Prevotella sp.]|nr:(deoxy)nucleoside triphosphate pyrophosphohydrolase [Prevotella sp.]
MKTIEVVAAVIRKDDKIFATQRGYGEWKDWWEFPGGKMEQGETPEEALKREIYEELSTDISVDEFLCTVEYDYPKFHLVMHCYKCSLCKSRSSKCKSWRRATPKVQKLHFGRSRSTSRITGRFFDPLKMADMIIMNGIKTL